MIIDKDGKLFGKIKVVDIIVVALIIVAAGFFASRYLGRGAQGGALMGPAADRLEITFFAEEVHSFVIDAISIGDPTREYAQFANFGTVTDILVGPSVTWAPDSGGALHEADKGDRFYSLTVKTTAVGTIDQVGFSVDGISYFVGRSVTLQIGQAGVAGRIAGVERIE